MKQLSGDSEKLFLGVVSAFAAELSLGKNDSGGQLKGAVQNFTEHLKKQYGEGYAPTTKIKTEVHYNSFKPFMWSWVFYLLCALLILLHLAFKGKGLSLAIWGAAIVGLALHNYGISLRVFISDRPPVSNMFETVIWVPLVAMLSALIAEYKSKSKLVLLGASLVSVLCLMLCHLAPTILDASFTPLELSLIHI